MILGYYFLDIGIISKKRSFTFSKEITSNMKRSLSLLVVLFCVLGAYAQAQEEITFAAKPAGDFAAPAFEWEAIEYDFGKIKQNVPVTHEFKFKNIPYRVRFIAVN